MPPLAQRVESIKQSDIRRYSAICAAMNGINLSQGVCDQPAPREVKEGAIEAIRDNQACYTNLRGIGRLRQAIARKMLTFNGIACDPETEVVVHVGSAGAFACAVLSMLNPGDECIVFSPFYSYHVNLLRLVGVKVNFVGLRPPKWGFDLEELKRSFTDRTRMVVITTPGNPSGKMFTTAELLQVADLAADHDAWIVTDEIYEYITYDLPHVSVGRFPQARSRTVTISGASKTFAVTGWRVGYAVGPAPLMERMSVVNDLLYICAPAPLQHGVAAGLALGAEYYEGMRADYRRKRNMLAEALEEIGLVPFIPEGSYYMLASFDSRRWSTAVEATESLLESTGVATVPGSAFYANPADGDGQLRFCFAKEDHVLSEACSRLRRWGAGAGRVESMKTGRGVRQPRGTAATSGD